MKSTEISAKKTNLVSLTDKGAVKQVLLDSVKIPAPDIKNA